MVKPQSPRILAAAALAALVIGLSSCATPQTLQPYTPAEGVNADVPRQGAPANSNEVPLKVRNLLIISTTGTISGAIVAPEDRADRLISIEGQVLDAENRPAGSIQPIQADLELPAGTLVVLTDNAPLQVSGPELEPGLISELKLTFANSQEQFLRVPVVDGTKEVFGSGSPSPTPTPTPTPGAATQPAAGAEPQTEPTQPSPRPGG